MKCEIEKKKLIHNIILATTTSRDSKNKEIVQQMEEILTNLQQVSATAVEEVDTLNTWIDGISIREKVSNLKGEETETCTTKHSLTVYAFFDDFKSDHITASSAIIETYFKNLKQNFGNIIKLKE